MGLYVCKLCKIKTVQDRVTENIDHFESLSLTGSYKPTSKLHHWPSSTAFPSPNQNSRLS